MSSKTKLGSLFPKRKTKSTKNPSNEIQNSCKMTSNGHFDIKTESLVEKLVSLTDKNELKAEIVKLLDENQRLKARVADLENQLQNGSSSDFVIDTVPMDEDEGTSTKFKYSATSSEVLTIPTEEDSKEEPPETRRVKGNACWNCDKDDHSIKDCKEPRNPQKIAANRKEFLKNQPQISNVRYHVDEPQKFGHLKPGLPSRKLRQALGLQADQLPSYIYRMREKGYPPGWLKEAEINHSNMALFVNQDQALPDHGDEDGEIVDSEDKKQYDVDKLQEWPGFNVPFEETMFVDETVKYRAPWMKEEQSKAKMVQEMSHKQQKGYVRGEMQDTSTKKVISTPEVVKTPARLSTSIKSIADGTPIVQMHSPFSSLPKAEMWTTNTTDHIMFENLPNSTGKWDEMTDLLKKVRSRVKGTSVSNDGT